MAYKEHQWDKGELITSEKLNHMELGIAEALGNTLIARATGSGQVTAEDAAAVPLANLTIAGKSGQVSTTGAQLLDPGKMPRSKTAGGITFKLNSDGTYTVSGTSTINYANAVIAYPLKPGSYYMSGGSVKTVYAKVDVMHADGAPTYNINCPFVILDSDKGMNLTIQVDRAGTAVNETIYPMLNAGTTAKPWEPYTGGQPSPSPAYAQPIISTGDNGNVEVTVTGDTQSQHITIPLAEPLRGLGEYQDRIMCEAGVWGVERSVAELTFDVAHNNNTAWKVGLATLNNGNYFAAYAPLKGRKIENTLCYCNRYKPTYAFTSNEKVDGVAVSEFGYIEPPSEAVYISVKKARLDTPDIAGFQKWVGENPVSFVYVIAVPTWEPLPAETQSALNALTAYQGRTTITVTAGGPAADVGLEYVRDINTVIADLQAQITALKGGKTS